MTQKQSSKFGQLIGTHEEDGKPVSVYLDGNQVYFVSGGKMLKGRTLHVDDLDDYIALLKEIEEQLTNEEEDLDD